MKNKFFLPEHQMIFFLAGVSALLFIGLQLLYAGEDLADWEISDILDDQMAEDPAVPADEIEVDVEEGIVKLEGNVDNILAADRAIALAGTVHGVRGVIDMLDVIAPHRTDIEIESDVDDALEADPAIRPWHILVSVDEGVVSLQGTVDSWQLKLLIEQTAKGVRGVREVANLLAVEFEEEREDDVIQEQITEALHWDPYVGEGLITVEVTDGVVILTGLAGSQAEKIRAANHAMVAGVESVDDEGLLVDPGLREEELREGIHEVKPDEQIADAVQAAIDHDPRVSIAEIEVEVVAGTVILKGTVDNLRAKRAAGNTARHVLGVTRIDNQIELLSEPPVDDHAVERRVRRAFLRHPYLSPDDFEVSAENGIVQLRGDVDTSFIRIQAEDTAAMQLGVIDVDNLIQVDMPEEMTYDPYLDPWSLSFDPPQ